MHRLPGARSGRHGAILAYSHGLLKGGDPRTISAALVCIAAGAVAGSLLAGVQGHPRRALGLVPLGATGMLIALAWAATSADVRWPCAAMGFMAALVNVPLRATYQAAVPADARGNGMAVLNTAYYLLAAGLLGLLTVLVNLRILTGGGPLWILALLAGAGALAAWWVLHRDSLELVLEIILWPIYRIRAYGPGVDKIPVRGPILVVANHVTWFDPLWLAKIMPRRVFPMMTSTFFDMPGLRWLMVHVVYAIRVPAVYMRREAPELNEAIAALDRGQCVLIFPEGMLRRRDETFIRRFGQGVWHILRQRPSTCVVVCWIEGGWGSVFSYKNGPPLRNKRCDWWRHIDIAVSEPQIVDPAILADQTATRLYLMRACLETRRYLNLDTHTDEAMRSAEAEDAAEAAAE